jgi:hypothetical protein
LYNGAQVIGVKGYWYSGTMMEAVCDPAGEISLAVMLEECCRPCEGIAGPARLSLDGKPFETAAFESIMTGNLVMNNSDRAMSTVVTTTSLSSP